MRTTLALTFWMTVVISALSQTAIAQPVKIAPPQPANTTQNTSAPATGKDQPLPSFALTFTNHTNKIITLTVPPGGVTCMRDVPSNAITLGVGKTYGPITITAMDCMGKLSTVRWRVNDRAPALDFNYAPKNQFVQILNAPYTKAFCRTDADQGQGKNCFDPQGFTITKAVLQIAVHLYDQ